MSNYRYIETCAARFKALSNPHRLFLCNRLMSCCASGPVCSTDETTRYCVGELGEGMDIAPSTVSHHLKELKQAGLIRMERQGQSVHCWVEPDVLSELAGFFAH